MKNHYITSFVQSLKQLQFQDIANRIPENLYPLSAKYRHWHKGYASEAAIACRNYAFYVLDTDWICSIIKEDNFASQQVAKRVGMKPEKEFMATYYNGPVKHLLYSVRREEI